VEKFIHIRKNYKRSQKSTPASARLGADPRLCMESAEKNLVSQTHPDKQHLLEHDRKIRQIRRASRLSKSDRWKLPKKSDVFETLAGPKNHMMPENAGVPSSLQSRKPGSATCRPRRFSENHENHHCEKAIVLQLFFSES
jgi:hypothetical protein